MFALTATLVAQLFVLNHKANPNPHFGFYVLGKPLAVTLVCLSLGLTLLGWWRWYNWQRNTVRGVCVVGGWELEGVLFVMMFVSFFPVLVERMEEMGRLYEYLTCICNLLVLFHDLWDHLWDWGSQDSLLIRLFSSSLFPIVPTFNS